MTRTRSRSPHISFALASILVLGGLACKAQSPSSESARDQEPARQMQGHVGDVETMHGRTGGVMSMGEMMGHMQGMHGRFQQMSQEQHWVHDGRMMPEGERMMSMSHHMASMTEAMQQAMGDMQSLMDRYGEGDGPQADHLQQMQQHLQAMAGQLDAMGQVMSEMPAAPAQGESP